MEQTLRFRKRITTLTIAELLKDSTYKLSQFKPERIDAVAGRPTAPAARRL